MNAVAPASHDRATNPDIQRYVFQCAALEATIRSGMSPFRRIRGEKLSWRTAQPYAIVNNALWVPLSVGLLMGSRKACHETLSWAYGAHEG
eukprot:6278926-Pyramimonas_sp.AAC.1